MTSTKSSPLSILYQKFPFDQCLDDHLFDTTNLIKHGLNLTIQMGTLTLNDIPSSEENIQTVDKLPQVLSDNQTQMSETNDEEIDYHIPPSPILIPIEPPKSSIKRRNSSNSSIGSFTTTTSSSPITENSTTRSSSSSDMSLLICRKKLQNMIEEFFITICNQNEKLYQEISNYVINSIVQNESNLESFLSKIVNHKYKRELVEIIQTLFMEKYEEIKLEELIDFLNNLINLRLDAIKDLYNPSVYKMYYKIWKLNINNYRYYDEEYFFDYFNNSFSNLENVLLQNGFLLNYKKFTHYFSKDLTNYDDDEEEDEEEEDSLDKEAPIKKTIKVDEAFIRKKLSFLYSTTDEDKYERLQRISRIQHGISDGEEDIDDINVLKTKSFNNLTNNRLTPPVLESSSQPSKKRGHENDTDVDEEVDEEFMPVFKKPSIVKSFKSFQEQQGISIKDGKHHFSGVTISKQYKVVAGSKASITYMSKNNNHNKNQIKNIKEEKIASVKT